MHPCICRVGSIREARQMCERAVAQKALLRTRGQTEMRSWKFDSAGAVAITGKIENNATRWTTQCQAAGVKRGKDRRRTATNHHGIAPYLYHGITGLVLVCCGNSFGAGRLFLTLIKPSPPQQPVNILHTLRLYCEGEGRLGPRPQHTQYTSRYQRDRAAGCAFEKCRV